VSDFDLVPEGAIAIKVPIYIGVKSAQTLRAHVFFKYLW
jgi:hypothetical protein